MDARWDEPNLDSFRDIRVILHPKATIASVRHGTATDGVDLSPMLSGGTQSAFECTVTLNWNYELFGTKNQPRPNNILEVQRWQIDKFVPIWIGIVESLSQYTISRGERSMQLTARTREQSDMFKTAKRVTPLFPQMTDLGYIAQRIALNVGLADDEIVLPHSGLSTAHSNTQMADMSAWEMLEAVFTATGWTPFIDNIGRLRAAQRTLMGADPTIVIKPEYVKRVNANRQRSSTSRVRVKWLDPVLKRNKRQGQKITGPVEVTMGWFLPWWKQTVWFSEDKTQRAEQTYINKDKKSANYRSANALWGFGPIRETYTQTAENKGVVFLENRAWVFGIWAMVAAWQAAHSVHDVITEAFVPAIPTAGFIGGSTIPGVYPVAASVKPTGRTVEGIAQYGLISLMVMIGNGLYEIWGVPYDMVHARNTTEAFDISVPRWIDNPEDIECDFIMDEPHAQAVAVRELVYRAWSQNKWQVELVDDPRIEFGDILEFPDGTKVYVEDYSRQLQRGSENVMSVQGFLLATTGQIGQVIQGPNPGGPDVVGPPPGGPGPGGGGGGGGGGDDDDGDDENRPPRIAPNMKDEVARTIAENPQINAALEGEQGERGEIVNITAKRLNGGADGPWGRKARRNNPADPRCNTDGLTYKRPDGMFEIYDCVVGGKSQASWSGYGPFKPGENGYWWPPLNY